MTEDRSLEDFVGDRSDTDAAESAESEPEPSDTADADTGAPDPAVATYRWDPEGVDCAACGESVERLWNGDDGFVCETCKEW